MRTGWFAALEMATDDVADSNRCGNGDQVEIELSIPTDGRVGGFANATSLKKPALYALSNGDIESTSAGTPAME